MIKDFSPKIFFEAQARSSFHQLFQNLRSFCSHLSQSNYSHLSCSPAESFCSHLLSTRVRLSFLACCNSRWLTRMREGPIMPPKTRLSRADCGAEGAVGVLRRGTAATWVWAVERCLIIREINWYLIDCASAVARKNFLNFMSRIRRTIMRKIGRVLEKYLPHTVRNSTEST